MTGPRFIRVPLLPVAAICLGDVVLHRPKLYNELRNHETIHWCQQKECSEFLRIYWDDYREARRAGYSHMAAYRRIRFEQEAYDHEGDGSYPAEREPFAWRAYTVLEE